MRDIQRGFGDAPKNVEHTDWCAPLKAVFNYLAKNVNVYTKISQYRKYNLNTVFIGVACPKK